MRFDAIKTTTFTAVLIMLIGYLGLFRPIESTIAERFAELDRETAVLDRRLSVARSAARLRRESAALQAELRRFRLHEDRARTVQRFLAIVSATAVRRNVLVAEITSGASVARSPVPLATPASLAATISASPASVVFDEIPLNLTVRGAYAGVLRTVRDLSSASVPARISIDSIALRDQHAGGTPQLTATIHATLLRELDEQSTLRARPA